MMSSAPVIGVLEAQGASKLGTNAALIAAPTDVLDDAVTNTGMQALNEAQGATTSNAHTPDGGVIVAGSFVDSHMIFLNTSGGTLGFHGGVGFTFSGAILGVMSDSGGNLEAASTFELGAPGSNYTTTFPGSGPAAPFSARGIESNNGTGLGVNDGYLILSPNTIRVSMRVTEPGD